MYLFVYTFCSCPKLPFLLLVLNFSHHDGPLSFATGLSIFPVDIIGDTTCVTAFIGIESLEVSPLLISSLEISICGGLFWWNLDVEPWPSLKLLREIDERFRSSICALRMSRAWVASVAEKVRFLRKSTVSESR